MYVGAVWVRYCNQLYVFIIQFSSYPQTYLNSLNYYRYLEYWFNTVPRVTACRSILSACCLNEYILE